MASELRQDMVFRLSLGMVNAYLVDDGDVTLIDAGSPNSVGDIESELESIGYSVDDIDRVLVTHFDVDHVGGISGLDLHSSIYLMEPDASFLDGSRKPSLINHKGLFQRVIDIWLTRPSGDVNRLDNGEVIGEFQVIHTPGHTPGHAVYIHEESGSVFLGDLVASENGKFTMSPWIFTQNREELESSIISFSNRNQDFDIGAVGHGDPIVEGADDVLDKLADKLRK